MATVTASRRMILAGGRSGEPGGPSRWVAPVSCADPSTDSLRSGRRAGGAQTRRTRPGFALDRARRGRARRGGGGKRDALDRVREDFADLAGLQVSEGQPRKGGALFRIGTVETQHVQIGIESQADDVNDAARNDAQTLHEPLLRAAVAF